MDFIKDLYNRPIAIEQEKANEQHYEVPTAFLQLCLGPRMKYSSCMWPSPKSSLGDAEDAMLASYCVEARLGRGLRGVGVPAGEEVEVAGAVGKEGEGLRILDLGCGWGSLGLFIAEVGHESIQATWLSQLIPALPSRANHHAVQLAYSKEVHRCDCQGEGLQERHCHYW